MSSVINFLPAKTFLAGEYLALEKREGLVLLTNPCFQMEYKSGQHLNIHPESPAGRYYEDHLSYFKNYNIEFKDPFLKHKKAGVGASTAQFLGLYSFKNPVFTDSDLLSTYLKYFTGSVRPSGVDILAQNHQNISSIEGGHVQEVLWPFKDLSFLIFFTGVKLNTHEHLESLKNLETSHFSTALSKIKKGLFEGQTENFLQGLNDYDQELRRQSFLAPSTKDILNRIHQIDEIQSQKIILASKGCGAMGSDSFILIVPRKFRDFTKERVLKNIFQGDEAYFLAHEEHLYQKENQSL
ncbi:MAG TPA: hypothetical protein PLJ21_07495 [Pseudobdellovibrionaceae bacterium]|nr:hypothetical protein [Pseudobdellovibrionaceae bacterium]